ncbi:hypothetical protein [Paratractidigestivibacter sp.]|uniref:hypothetical protein n=2 Tax=Paratractidigestivibacter sp. TaxID=2847316 RepID=UPI002ACB10A9|nr:hypothetical protein [Paratractidigestivibacter sp.]
MQVGFRANTRTGSGSGSEKAAARVGRAAGPALLSIGAFIDDEGGYTTVAMAVALLVSLTLVFSAASAQWVSSRSAEVQEVADAAAMAGANAVAAYATIAQALDACVLSMGLTGIVVTGAGFVASCVPPLAAAGAKLTASGAQILDARRDFAKSAASGLQKLESALPAIVVANSASCVLANSEEGLGYGGCAVPYPQKSQSDFSALDADVDDSAAEGLAEQMRSLAAEEKAAKKAADDAKDRGWRADCGNNPSYCMYQRTSTLAGLGGDENPMYPTRDSWNFGAALLRARNYYAARLRACEVTGSNGEELTDSACLRAFFGYALNKVRQGSYSEDADGAVSIDLPSLPHDTAETRETELFTDRVWPCTAEEAGRVLHSSMSCPGAQGAYDGDASLADLDAGGVLLCEECRMSVGNMGRAAAASTSIGNGFEHWWREVVEASKDYQEARNREVAAKKSLKQKASEGADLFKKAMEALSVVRPKLCPPGAYGCVAVVVRGPGTAVPSELTAAFISSAELPAGAAVSTAALAPDSSTAENNILASFFDGLAANNSLVGGMLDGVATLWGKLLVGYGSAYGSLAEAGDGLLDKLDGVLGGSVGSWLKGKLSEIMGATGLEPADMRLRKPVLANTGDVLAKAGYDRASTVRSLINAIPDSGSASDYVRALGVWAVDTFAEDEYTVAELTVPGTKIKIPLKVDVKKLVSSL